MNLLPDKPIVLTIAGFDPSGCAGLLADIKTFEASGVYGMAVCTANTEQNVASFERTNWIDKEQMFNQLRVLQREMSFEFVKVGLIESLGLLNELTDFLIDNNPSVKIVWDPVCRATANFVFHAKLDGRLLEEICNKLYLVTPNLDELEILAPGLNVEDGGKYLSQFCGVLVKGGHGSKNTSTDILFSKGGQTVFEAERLSGYSKRGTGCVMSSAIVANLAKGIDLEQACAKAKEYVRQYLVSNHSLVGAHSYEN